jgi:hypothetical protein
MFLNVTEAQDPLDCPDSGWAWKSRTPGWENDADLAHELLYTRKKAPA